jgi:serine/threonine protein kinase
MQLYTTVLRATLRHSLYLTHPRACSRHRETGQVLALKILDITAIDDELSEIQREMAFQAACNSAYVTQYHGSYLRGTDLWILMEYMGGGSARDLVRAPLLPAPTKREQAHRIAHKACVHVCDPRVCPALSTRIR